MSGSVGSILSQEPSTVLETFAKALFVSISRGIHVAVDVLDPVLFMMPWISRPVNATPQNPPLSNSSVFGNQATTSLWTTTLLSSQGYSFYHVLFGQCSPCLRKAWGCKPVIQGLNLIHRWDSSPIATVSTTPFCFPTIQLSICVIILSLLLFLHLWFTSQLQKSDCPSLNPSSITH